MAVAAILEGGHQGGDGGWLVRDASGGYTSLFLGCVWSQDGTSDMFIAVSKLSVADARIPPVTTGKGIRVVVIRAAFVRGVTRKGAEGSRD